MSFVRFSKAQSFVMEPAFHILKCGNELSCIFPILTNALRFIPIVVFKLIGGVNFAKLHKVV